MKEMTRSKMMRGFRCKVRSYSVCLRNPKYPHRNGKLTRIRVIIHEIPDFKWSQKLNELKKSVFSIDTFRPLQLQTMNATLSGKDCILIMPTGGGKSLCFQLPALISQGNVFLLSVLKTTIARDFLTSCHILCYKRNQFTFVIAD